jgi:WD40 repeat protein
MNADSPRTTGVRRGRIILWILMGIFCVLVFWQWRVRAAYVQSVRQLVSALREVDSGARQDLTPALVSEMLNSSESTGPVEQSSKQLIVHRWTAPFASYSVRLHVNDEGRVESFDTLSTIPEVVTRKNIQPNWSAKDLKEIHRGKHFRAADAAYDAIEVSTVDGLNPHVVTRIQDNLKLQPENPLQVKSTTVLRSEVAQRRRAWYRKLWVESYQKYSHKDPAWTDLAEQLVELAATEFAGARSLADARQRLSLAASKVAATGCTDPLVQSLVRQFTYTGLERQTTTTEVFDAFYDSNYPANVAYLSSFPVLDVKDLLRLQIARTPEGETVKHDLLNVTDPIEMRIIYHHLNEMLTTTVNAVSLRTFQVSQTSLLLGSQNPTLWLQYMLQSQDARQRQEWDSALTCFCNAWDALPDNPEAAANILKIALERRLGLGMPYASIAGEKAEFWFCQSIHGQFDYLSAYQFYAMWRKIETKGSQSGIMELAQRCLNTERFDTDVPVQFIEIIRHCRRQHQICPEASASIQGRLCFGTKQVYDGLQALVKGYADSSELRFLQSFLACSAYMQGDIKQAASLLDTLENQLDSRAVAECQVTVDQIRRAAKMPPQPFLFAPQRSVFQLQFSNDGDSLLFTDGDSQVHRMQLSSGTIEQVSRGDEHFRLIQVPDDSNDSVVVYSEENGASLRKQDTLAIVNRINIPVAVKSILLPQNAECGFCATHVESDQLTLSVFRPASDELLASIPGEFDAVSSVDVAARKHLIALVAVSESGGSLGTDTRAEIWDWSNGQQLFSLQPFTSSVDGISLSPEGSWVAVSGSSYTDQFDIEGVPLTSWSVKIMDIESKNDVAILPHPARITCMLMHESRNLLITGCADGIVRLWNPSSGELVSKFIGHSDSVSSMASDPEKGLLATGGADGRIHIWHIESKAVDVRLAIPSQPLNSISRMQVDPRTNDILTESREEGAIRWRADSNYLTHEAIPPGFRSWADGREFLVQVLRPRFDDQTIQGPSSSTVEIREIGGSESVLKVQVAGTGSITPILTPDLRSLIIGGNVPTVVNAETGEPWQWGLLTGHRGFVDSINLSRDGRFLLTCCNLPTQEVFIWELPENCAAADAEAKLLLQWTPETRLEYLNATLSPIGDFFFLADGKGKTQFRDVAKGQLKGELEGINPVVSPDGARIAIDSPQSRILVYDTETFAVQEKIPYLGGRPGFLQWGSDNYSLVYTIEDWIYGIDTRTGKEILGRIPDTTAEVVAGSLAGPAVWLTRLPVVPL